MELMFSFYCLCVSVRSAGEGAIKLGFAQQEAALSFLLIYLFRDDGNGIYVSRILKGRVKGKVIKNISLPGTARVLSHKIAISGSQLENGNLEMGLVSAFFIILAHHHLTASEIHPRLHSDAGKAKKAHQKIFWNNVMWK